MKIGILVSPTTAAIEAASRDSMAGNTDWYYEDVADGTAATLLNGDLHDDHGAALYKFVSGAVTERTEAERKAEWGTPVQEKSEQELISDIEYSKAVTDYNLMMGNLEDPNEGDESDA